MLRWKIGKTFLVERRKLLRLTPLDIKKQEFKRAMRGYDVEEVNTFLEMVAEEFEALQREKNRLEEEAVKLRTQLHDYQEVERTLKQTLMHAQESLQLSRENSKREADMLISEAELQAEKITEEAKMKLAQLKNELLLVRAQKDSFARRLRHLLESQLELIGVLELDDLGFGENDHRPLSASPYSQEKDLPAKRPAAARPLGQESEKNPGGMATSRNTISRRPERKTPDSSSASGRTGGIPIEVVSPIQDNNSDYNEERTEPKISDHFIT
jgi:cell division initiation protein